jgi:ABC-type polysaccharide/polyol phosphate export permease
MQFTLRIWFYASPVLYTIDRIPESARPMYLLNPFASLFESYRNVLIKGTGPDDFLFFAFLISLAIAILGFSVCGRIGSRVAKEL